jgi:hypothetical protein
MTEREARREDNMEGMMMMMLARAAFPLDMERKETIMMMAMVARREDMERKEVTTTTARVARREDTERKEAMKVHCILHYIRQPAG